MLKFYNLLKFYIKKKNLYMSYNYLILARTKGVLII